MSKSVEELEKEPRSPGPPALTRGWHFILMLSSVLETSIGQWGPRGEGQDLGIETPLRSTLKSARAASAAGPVWRAWAWLAGKAEGSRDAHHSRNRTSWHPRHQHPWHHGRHHGWHLGDRKVTWQPGTSAGRHGANGAGEMAGPSGSEPHPVIPTSVHGTPTAWLQSQDRGHRDMGPQNLHPHGAFPNIFIIEV